MIRSPLGPIALLALLFAVPPAFAGAWSGSVAVTSDHVFRGISQSAGHGALQAGVRYVRPGGFFAGAWASTIDQEPPSGEARSLEIDLWAGWSFPLPGPWTAEASVVRYLYPDGEPVDYDYSELALGLHFRDTLSLTAAWTNDAFGRGREAVTAELTLRWPLGRGLHAVGGAGRYETDGPFLGGYGFWSLGVTAPLGPLTVDLTWFDTDGEAERAFGERAGGRLVLGFGATLP